jgi:hypothetical protein
MASGSEMASPPLGLQRQGERTVAGTQRGFKGASYPLQDMLMV